MRKLSNMVMKTLGGIRDVIVAKGKDPTVVCTELFSIITDPEFHRILKVGKPCKHCTMPIRYVANRSCFFCLNGEKKK